MGPRGQRKANEPSPEYPAQQEKCVKYFDTWTEDEQVQFVEHLISRMCHHQHGQVNTYLKPMLQRDFISALPGKSLALSAPKRSEPCLIWLIFLLFWNDWPLDHSTVKWNAPKCHFLCSVHPRFWVLELYLLNQKRFDMREPFGLKKFITLLVCTVVANVRQLVTMAVVWSITNSSERLEKYSLLCKN